MTVSVGAELLDVLRQTWPAAETRRCGPVTLNRSSGGGQRVTAAHVVPGAIAPDGALAEAEAQMAAWGQRALYMVTDGDQDLDKRLETRGFRIGDPTILFACPLDRLLEIETPRLSTFSVWPILAIQADIWAEGGIGPDRLAVMDRVRGPHTTLFARSGDRPAATGFVASHEDTAMVHALEVRTAHRRHGVAKRMMGHAAQWARDQGCTNMALAVTEANAPARALYTSLGMAPAGRYHYRIRPLEPS